MCSYVTVGSFVEKRGETVSKITKATHISFSWLTDR